MRDHLCARKVLTMPKPIVEVLFLNGENITLRLKWTANIGRLKEKIQMLRGIKATRQVLVTVPGEMLYDGMQLQDIVRDRQSFSNDKPVVSFTLLQSKRPCACCGQRFDHMKHCSACETTYCSNYCQHADWPSHKHICNPPA